MLRTRRAEGGRSWALKLHASSRSTDCVHFVEYLLLVLQLACAALGCGRKAQDETRDVFRNAQKNSAHGYPSAMCLRFGCGILSTLFYPATSLQSALLLLLLYCTFLKQSAGWSNYAWVGMDRAVQGKESISELYLQHI